MKKKLLVILGAGCSVACGMPSFADLDQSMRHWAELWANAREWQNYYEALWTDIKNYYKTERSGPHLPLNFEKVLGEMIALSHWVTPAPSGNTLRKTACDCMPPRLTFSHPKDYGPVIDIHDQLVCLLKELAGHVRGLSRRIDPKDDSVRTYAAMIDALREEFDVGIYNLNYDTVALTAWPRAYVGFASSGKFDARAIHRRRKWNFIYHLHGSVHHSLIGAFMEQMEWREDLGGTFNDGPENLNHRLDGKSLPKTTLIAGGYKLEQLLAEPFHSFHAALVRHLYEAKAILIGGYGFADEHVNRALRNRLLNAADNDRPRVAVIDYGQNKNTSAEFSNDPWDHYLCTSLNISRLSTPKPPSEFAAAKEFEIPNPRVTIWYSGFIQAQTALAAS